MKKLLALMILLAVSASSAFSFSIRGTLKDAQTNNPLSGIEVSLQTSTAYLHTLVDADGNFEFSGLASGSYLLYYWRFELVNGVYYLHQEYGNITISNADVSDILFELQPHVPEYALIGTVYDAETMSPVALDYAMQVKFDDFQDQYEWIVADDNGNYEVSNLPDWSYTLEWDGNSYYEGFSQQVVIEAGGSIPLVADIYLQPRSGRTLSGVLKDFETNEPIAIAGRSLRLFSVTNTFYAETEADGSFSFVGIEAQSYSRLEVLSQDTSYYNGDGSEITDIFVPDEGITNVEIFQHRFQSVHELVSDTDEFIAGESKTFELSLTHTDGRYGEVWGVTLNLPDGVTAESTTAFVDELGSQVFGRNYACSDEQKLTWEGHHPDFIGYIDGNLDLLNSTITATVTLNFDASLTDEDIVIGYEVLYTYACQVFYFSYGSLAMTDMSSTITGLYDNAVKESPLSAYPNPFRDNVNLSFELEESETATLQVHSLNGQLVIDQQLGRLNAGQNRLKLDLKGLNTGLYLMSIYSQNAVYRSKLYKQ